VWAGVVVIPSSKAYEPSKELEQVEEPKEEETVAAAEQAANGGQSESVEPKMELN